MGKWRDLISREIARQAAEQRTQQKETKRIAREAIKAEQERQRQTTEDAEQFLRENE